MAAEEMQPRGGETGFAIVNVSARASNTCETGRTPPIELLYTCTGGGAPYTLIPADLVV